MPPPHETLNSSSIDTSPTEWPPNFPQPVKDLIIHLFTILEAGEADIRVRLAHDIFTPTGCFINVNGTYRGTQEILNSQSDSAVKKRHNEWHLLRVYAAGPSNKDLMILAQSNNSVNDKTLLFDHHFRAVIDDPTSEAPHLELLQVWTDFTPLYKATKSFLDARKKNRASQDAKCCTIL